MRCLERGNNKLRSERRCQKGRIKENWRGNGKSGRVSEVQGRKEEEAEK